MIVVVVVVVGGPFQPDSFLFSLLLRKRDCGWLAFVSLFCFIRDTMRREDSFLFLEPHSISRHRVGFAHLFCLFEVPTSLFVFARLTYTPRPGTCFIRHCVCSFLFKRVKSGVYCASGYYRT